MAPFQKPANEIGAAWEKQNKKGESFLSVRLDVTHSPETALALANMLLSGQAITFLASVNERATPDNTKIPKYSMYMSQQQHTWMLASYNRVYPAGQAPVFDYRNPSAPQQSYAPPATMPYPPAATPAPVVQNNVPPTPYPPQYPNVPHAAQMPSAPAAPAPASPNNAPANPFGVQ
jgi:hypothetical protein